VIDLYAPGNSLLHRAPAWTKFAGLFAVVIAAFLTDNLIALVALLAASVAIFLVTGLGPRRLWRTARPVLIFVAVIVILQVIFGHPGQAAVYGVRVVFTVLLASILTYTTRASEILEFFHRLLTPLRRVGVSPWRASLVLSLTIRSIPVIIESVAVSREAFAARGQRKPTFEIIIPVIVRIIRSSEAIGEAIAARGLDTDVSATDLTTPGQRVNTCPPGPGNQEVLLR
jgi:biotin transport system permease protein